MTGALRRIGSASSYLLVQSLWVSETAMAVQISSVISTSSNFAVSTRKSALWGFFSYLVTWCRGFLRRCFVKKYGLHVTRYLIHDLRESSIRQCGTTWTAFLRYVGPVKLSSCERKTILVFFICYLRCGRPRITPLHLLEVLWSKPGPLVLTFGLLQSGFAELSQSFSNFRLP